MHFVPMRKTMRSVIPNYGHPTLAPLKYAFQLYNKANHKPVVDFKPNA